MFAHVTMLCLASQIVEAFCMHLIRIFADEAATNVDLHCGLVAWVHHDDLDM